MAVDAGVDIDISVDLIGKGQVVVDGVDISKSVRAVHFVAGVDQLTTVLLEMSGQVEVKARAAVAKIPAATSQDVKDITSIADSWRLRRKG